MSRVVVVGALPESLINFRSDLLESLVAHGHNVIAMADAVKPDVVQRLSAIGVRFRIYPVKRNGMNPVADLQTFFALRKAFNVLKPDIVLAYTVKPVIWGGIALKGLSGTRFYALITGLGFAFNESASFRRRMLTILVSWLYHASLSKASRIIFQNPDDQSHFIKRKIISKSNCVLVKGSGVNLDRFAVATLPGENKKIVFLAIGRLLSEKGFREYFKAAKLIKTKYPDIIFNLVGPEDPSPDGISLAEVQSWNAMGVIQYLGKTLDVRPFIADCHVYVLPSYHEGMPRTVLEAMSMGRPIITTNASGCRETVKLLGRQILDKNSEKVIEGENGFLVPIKNTVKLADAMKRFIVKPELIQQMGRCSREIAKEKFDVHKVNEVILQAIGLK